MIASDLNLLKTKLRQTLTKSSTDLFQDLHLCFVNVAVRLSDSKHVNKDLFSIGGIVLYVLNLTHYLHFANAETSLKLSLELVDSLTNLWPEVV